MTATQAGVTENPQLDLQGERIIGDEDLHILLDVRAQKKKALEVPQEAFRSVDVEARGRIAAMALDPGRYRCGKYVISVTERPARSVAFDTAASRQVRILAPGEPA